MHTQEIVSFAHDIFKGLWVIAILLLLLTGYMTPQ